MLVKALKRHKYDGRIRMQGDEYDVHAEKHVRVLEAMRKVRRVPQTITAAEYTKPNAVEGKDTKKKPSKKKTSKKKSEKKTDGKYKRKDMVAE